MSHRRRGSSSWQPDNRLRDDWSRPTCRRRAQCITSERTDEDGDPMTTVDVQQLHESAVVADTHNDLLMAVVARTAGPLGQLLPRQLAAAAARRWRRRAGPAGVHRRRLPARGRAAPDPADDRGGSPDRRGERRRGGVVPRRRRSSTRALTSGRIALVLALESCPGIDADVELSATMHRLGVRDRLAHSLGANTGLADGSGDDATGSRLTGAGVAALRREDGASRHARDGCLTPLDGRHRTRARARHPALIASHSGPLVRFWTITATSTRAT